MGMVVRSNLMAQNANRQLGMNNSTVSKNLEKLSSGFKINRAGDDASGLAISEKMKAQIKGLETASANSQDGISLVQTAEGALTEVHSMLNRMTELATKSANGTIKDEVDRDAIQKEVNALNDEIDRISQSTNFNGINLLDGSMGAGKTGASGALTGGGAPTVSIEGVDVGTQLVFADGKTVANGTNTAAKVGNVITITLGTKDAVATFTEKDLNALLKANDIQGTIKLSKDIKTAGVAEAVTMTAITAAKAVNAQYKLAIGNQDFKLTSDSAGAAKFTFGTAGTGSTGATLAGTVVTLNLTAANQFSAADVNKLLKGIGVNFTADFKGTLTGTQITGAIVAGNLTAGAGLAGEGLELQVGDTADAFNQVSVSVDDMSAQGIGTANLDVSTQAAAKAAQAVIKDGINKVSTNRASLGALQNRLEYTINNLDVSAENMSAANSRIRDTDMAKQMMEYTKMNVLTQAAQAMLAQANQQPQSILQLLQ